MRSARSRTCDADSSPVTYRTVRPDARSLRRDVEQQGGLADAGLAGEQDHRPGHEAAAEHAVELVDAGRDRARGLDVDLGDRPGRRA